MKQRPSATFWASAARVSVHHLCSCEASGSGRGVSVRKDHACSRARGEGRGRDGASELQCRASVPRCGLKVARWCMLALACVHAEASTPCRCRRHPNRVAVRVPRRPQPCDQPGAWRREGSGAPRTIPQTHTARRPRREHLHRKRLSQANHLLPPPYNPLALLVLAPPSAPPLAPAIPAIAARPAPLPSPPCRSWRSVMLLVSKGRSQRLR